MRLIMNKRRIMLGNLSSATATATGDVATFNTDVVAPFKNCIVNFTPVQEGSGDPSPDNVRPISGWTGCNVYDDSKYGGLVEWNQIIKNGNFADGTTNWSTNGTSLSASNGKLTVTATSGGSHSFYQPYTATVGHMYYLSAKVTNKSNVSRQVAFRFGSNFTIRTVTLDVNETAIVHWYNTPSTQPNVNNFYVYILGSEGDVFEFENIWVSDITSGFGTAFANIVREKEAAHAGDGVAYINNLLYKDYYPYSAGGTLMTVGQVNGEAYRAVEVDWTDTAGTVYGGSYDVASGVLTVTKGYLDMGTRNWTYYQGSVGQPFFYITLSDAQSTGQAGIAICTMYPNSGTSGTDKRFRFNGQQVRVYDSAYTDATAFKTAMSGVYLAYELATPITYQLTPETIRSLRGTNNVWNDMNGETSVTYIHGVTQNAIWQP